MSSELEALREEIDRLQELGGTRGEWIRLRSKGTRLQIEIQRQLVTLQREIVTLQRASSPAAAAQQARYEAEYARLRHLERMCRTIDDALQPDQP